MDEDVQRVLTRQRRGLERDRTRNDRNPPLILCPVPGLRSSRAIRGSSTKS